MNESTMVVLPRCIDKAALTVAVVTVKNLTVDTSIATISTVKVNNTYTNNNHMNNNHINDTQTLSPTLPSNHPPHQPPMPTIQHPLRPPNPIPSQEHNALTTTPLPQHTKTFRAPQPNQNNNNNNNNKQAAATHSEGKTVGPRVTRRRRCGSLWVRGEGECASLQRLPRCWGGDDGGWMWLGKDCCGGEGG